MTTRLAPASEDELAALLAEASARRTPLAVTGGGTRSGLGRPVQAERELATAMLTGITLYEPAELVLSARAGTPLAEIEGVLGQSGQRLAFEPMDHRPLYASRGEPTIGAVAAANISGPRRVLSGAARDSLIGVRAVTGRGEIMKSGGRVMKNVAGYDLVRFLSGSHGTLAVMTEVTFKVLPAPETESTLVLRGLGDVAAVEALSVALGSPFEVAGAAHRPAQGGDASETWIRVEGFAQSVAHRLDRLRQELARFGVAGNTLAAPESRALWSDIRDLKALAAAPDDVVWRVSVRPSDGPAIAEAARRAGAARMLMDWGGGLLWIAMPPAPDAGASVLRGAVRSAGGHATLVRAPEDTRRTVPVFEPLAAPLMDLSRRLKQTFDPSNVLNPGRMYGDV